MMVLDIPMTNQILNMLEHKVINVLLVDLKYDWNTKLLQLTKCCTNVNNFTRLLNESFFLENKFYYDQY